VRDKCNDVCHNLVFIKDSINNDGDERGQVSLARDFDHDNDQATSLENGAID
jgi:hypothetical protein